jgi:hypothetical protein
MRVNLVKTLEALQSEVRRDKAGKGSLRLLSAILPEAQVRARILLRLGFKQEPRTKEDTASPSVGMIPPQIQLLNRVSQLGTMLRQAPRAALPSARAWCSLPH